MIEVIGYEKAYPKLIAVAGITFRVEPGQVLGLVGPNGAGKTTTLRAIAGIIPPTKGELRICGHDVRRQPIEAKRLLAYVPDDPRLFEALTVWEHLRYSAAAYRLTDFTSAAERLLERFELMEKRDTVAQELSRGMRQKVAICCAFLHEPRAVLFDEPLTGLDPRAIRVMKDTIHEYTEKGASVIMSSHLLSLVEDLCTHLLILHRGASLYFGPLESARMAFADLHGDASLEEVFLRATADPPAIPGSNARP